MAEPLLRYVVLRHEGVANPHFDLMFETSPGSPLATWRAMEWPIKNGSPMEYLADHRNAYLNYEGPISNNRGHVQRVMAGTHNVIEASAESLVIQIVDGPSIRLFLGNGGPAQLL